MEKALTFIMAARLKELREAHGFSHLRLSAALREKYGIKISKDALISYEAPEFHARAGANEGMSVRYLRSLADFYGVSVGYILGLEDLPDPDANKRAFQQMTGLNDAALSVLTEKFAAQSRLFPAGTMTPSAFINRLLSTPRMFEASTIFSKAFNTWVSSEYPEEEAAPPSVPDGFYTLSGKEYSDIMKSKSTDLIMEALRLVWVMACHEHGTSPDNILLHIRQKREEEDNG